VPTTFALIPGAGGSAWYWHRVLPLLEKAGSNAVAVELPMSDDTADLNTYADIVCHAVADVSGPLVVVGQSMGAFTAPIVATRVPTSSLILVNPMIPMAGESAGSWWEATGQRAARIAYFTEIGLGDRDFDMAEDFFHDVPDAVREEAFSTPEPRESETPFRQIWPLDGWPDVPTRVIQGRDDRCFPLDFQRRIARERLGVDVEEMPGGHLMALSEPRDLAARLLNVS
jgi:pimeloyl-ACP methyl ester carboxylesterase